MLNPSPVVVSFNDAVLIVSGLCMGVIPIFWELKEDIPINWNDPNSFGGKKLNTMGRIFIGIVIVAFMSGGLKFVWDGAAKNLADTKEKQSLARELKTSNETHELILGHTRDSLNNVRKEEVCKKDAEIAEIRNQEEFARLRDSLYYSARDINKNIERSSKKTNDKLDSVSRGKPAFVELLRLPDTAVHVDIRGDTLSGKQYIENSGDATAFDLNTYTDIIFIIDGKPFIITDRYSVGAPSSLSGGTKRLAFFKYLFPTGFLKKVDRIYFITNGSFFSDDDLTKKKKVQFGGLYFTETKRTVKYDLAMSMDNLIKKSIPADKIIRLSIL